MYDRKKEIEKLTLSPRCSDTSSTLEKALLAFTSAHPCPIPATLADIAAIRTLASLISRRSAALLGAAVFSLWELRYETAVEQACDGDNVDVAAAEKPAVTIEEDLTTPPRTKVAFNGSVIEHYPGYLAKCQAHITALIAGSENPVLAAGSIDLVPAVESSIIGAAVALGCALAEGQTS